MRATVKIYVLITTYIFTLGYAKYNRCDLTMRIIGCNRRQLNVTCLVQA